MPLQSFFDGAKIVSVIIAKFFLACIPDKVLEKFDPDPPVGVEAASNPQEKHNLLSFGITTYYEFRARTPRSRPDQDF